MHTPGPAASFFVPGGHARQERDPDWGVYFPASQTWQGPPSGPVYPSLQVQSAITELPGGDVEFAGQSAHSHVPATQCAYVPAPHCGFQVNVHPACSTLLSVLNVIFAIPVGDITVPTRSMAAISPGCPHAGLSHEYTSTGSAP
eukprot:3726950-Rhodomonas_salina.1